MFPSFLGWFATALILLVFGLRMEMRMPDQNGPGEEFVEIHGIRIFHRPIDRPEVVKQAPYSAIVTAVTVIGLGSVAAGLLGVIWNLVKRMTQGPPAASLKEDPEVASGGL